MEEIVSWRGRRVLVTGAGGFLGSHLSEQLVAAGARTRAFVHYRGDGGRGWLDDTSVADAMEVVAGDVRDQDSLERAMDGIEVVFHLAALIGIPYSYAAPLSYLRTNVEGTLNVLQAARSAGVARVIHTSTSEVYGTAVEVPISESHPLRGQSPYSATKIAADKMVQAFHLSFGLPVVTVRPFNAFGPRQSARAIIPTIITQALQGRPVRLGNLHTTRDFTYVTDTVAGFLRAAEIPDAVGRTLNLGSGREITIEALVRAIGDVLQHPIEVSRDDTRVRPAGTEVDRLLADARLAHCVLGWRPAVEFAEGLQRTVHWVREHLDRYRPEAYAV